MAIADVVTMGFGTFSSVTKVPTLGYSIDTSTPSGEGNIEFSARGCERLQYRAGGVIAQYAASTKRLQFRAGDTE